MSCEQELCPFWSGTGGCDCEVFQIEPDERRREQRALGIETPADDAGMGVAPRAANSSPPIGCRGK